MITFTIRIISITVFKTVSSMKVDFHTRWVKKMSWHCLIFPWNPTFMKAWKLPCFHESGIKGMVSCLFKLQDCNVIHNLIFASNQNFWSTVVLKFRIIFPLSSLKIYQIAITRKFFMITALHVPFLRLLLSDDSMGTQTLSYIGFLCFISQFVQSCQNRQISRFSFLKYYIH